MKTMPAGKFKATCLSVMDEIQRKREQVVVTKNGKPVARMLPMDMEEGKDPLDAFYFGKIEIPGDIMAPLYSDAELEEFSEASLAQLK